MGDLANVSFLCDQVVPPFLCAIQYKCCSFFFNFTVHTWCFGHVPFPLTICWLSCSWEWSQVHHCTLGLIKISLSPTAILSMRLRLLREAWDVIQEAFVLCCLSRWERHGLSSKASFFFRLVSQLLALHGELNHFQQPPSPASIRVLELHTIHLQLNNNEIRNDMAKMMFCRAPSWKCFA